MSALFVCNSELFQDLHITASREPEVPYLIQMLPIAVSDLEAVYTYQLLGVPMRDTTLTLKSDSGVYQRICAGVNKHSCNRDPGPG